MGMGLGLSLRLGNVAAQGGSAPPSANALSLPYDGLHIPEGAAQGTKVATIQNLPVGSPCTITGITNAAGSAVSSSILQLVGTDLQAGSVASLASDSFYNVTVSTGVRDTTFTIYVAAQGVVPTGFTDNFAGTDGTTLIAHDSRWVAAGAIANSLLVLDTNRAKIGTSGIVVTDTGTMNHFVTFDVVTAVMAGFDAMASWLDNFNNVRVYFTNPTAGAAPAVRVNVKAFPANTMVANVTGPASLINATSMTVHIRVINNKIYVYVGPVGGALTLSVNGVDITGGNFSSLVGLNSSGGTNYIDNWESGQVGTGTDFTRFGAATTLSCVQRDTPVYAYDLTALKAQIPVTVSWSTTAPTALQIRAVDSATGTAVSGYDWADWTNCVIGTNGAGGWFLVPKYNNYAIEVRDKNNTSMLVRAPRQSCGIVALFCKSQSNVTNALTATGATNAYSGQGITWMLDPALPFSGGLSGSPKDTDTNSFSNFVAPVIAGGGGATMAVVFGASGQRSDYFLPTRSYYPTTLPILHRHCKRFNVLLTQQGESDCDAVVSSGWAIDNPTTGWLANSKTTIDAYFAACNQSTDSVPVLVGITGFENANTPVVLQGSAGALASLKQRKRERDLAALYARGALSMHMYDRTTAAGGGVHAISADYTTKAMPRWGWAAAKSLALATNDRMGPKVTGVSRSGKVVTVTLDLNGATTLTDNLAGSVNGNNLYDGWQAVLAGAVSSPEATDGSFNTPALTPPLTWDSGTLPSYSALGQVGTLTLTLLSDPGASVAVRYMASTSGTTPVVFDGASPFTGTYQSGASNYNPYKQILGTYSDVGNVGLAPMIDALVG